MTILIDVFVAMQKSFFFSKLPHAVGYLQVLWKLLYVRLLSLSTSARVYSVISVCVCVCLCVCVYVCLLQRKWRGMQMKRFNFDVNDV